MRELRYPIWKQLAIFGLLGPVLGSVTIFVGGGLPDVAVFQLPATLMYWLALTLPMAYFVGLVPALGAGAAAAVARSQAPTANLLSLIARLAVPVAVGSALSVGLLVLLGSEPDFGLARVGAVAAVVCAGLVEWRASVRPNNSSKPTPLRGAA